MKVKDKIINQMIEEGVSVEWIRNFKIFAELLEKEFYEGGRK